MGNKSENKIHINVFNIFHVKFAKFYDFPKLNEKKIYILFHFSLSFVRSCFYLSIHIYVIYFFPSFSSIRSIHNQIKTYGIEKDVKLNTIDCERKGHTTSKWMYIRWIIMFFRLLLLLLQSSFLYAHDNFQIWYSQQLCMSETEFSPSVYAATKPTIVCRTQLSAYIATALAHSVVVVWGKLNRNVFAVQFQQSGQWMD